MFRPLYYEMNTNSNEFARLYLRRCQVSNTLDSKVPKKSNLIQIYFLPSFETTCKRKQV